MSIIIRRRFEDNYMDSEQARLTCNEDAVNSYKQIAIDTH